MEKNMDKDLNQIKVKDNIKTDYTTSEFYTIYMQLFITDEKKTFEKINEDLIYLQSKYISDIEVSVQIKECLNIENNNITKQYMSSVSYVTNNICNHLSTLNKNNNKITKKEQENTCNSCFFYFIGKFIGDFSQCMFSLYTKTPLITYDRMAALFASMLIDNNNKNKDDINFINMYIWYQNNATLMSTIKTRYLTEINSNYDNEFKKFNIDTYVENLKKTRDNNDDGTEETKETY
jgi:hypothetical protein